MAIIASTVEAFQSCWLLTTVTNCCLNCSFYQQLQDYKDHLSGCSTFCVTSEVSSIYFNISQFYFFLGWSLGTKTSLYIVITGFASSASSSLIVLWHVSLAHNVRVHVRNPNFRVQMGVLKLQFNSSESEKLDQAMHLKFLTYINNLLVIW